MTCQNGPVTVAAVILAATSDSALAEVEGLPRVRRLVDVAWAGGAVPIIVVAPDPSGAIAAALAGAPVTLASPVPTDGGPAAQIERGMAAAVSEVRDTDAALIWPARVQWVDAETITSLIEAHGAHPGLVLRPSFEGAPGWPVLIPAVEVDRLSRLGPARSPDELLDDLLTAGAVEARLDLGDPGVVHDADTARADLPPFVGPPGPQSGHHEWGAQVDETPVEAPLEGPSLAPFGQANEAEDPASGAEA
jgi:CTP:molybdopterin cytidylyltransferase MocA